MRLVHSGYGLDLEIRENMINVLVIESPDIFSSMINELLQQKEGEPGGFILSEQDIIEAISKTSEIIINPFAINCNEKRIQQKLYQELLGVMNDCMIEKTVHLQGQMMSYLEELLQQVPYPLEFDIDENWFGILKLCHVEIDDQGETLAEKIVNYIKVLKQFCNIHIIFFVNLKSYLTQEELEELYRFSFYEKISLILFENSMREKIENESICIFDKDMCIIRIE